MHSPFARFLSSSGPVSTFMALVVSRFALLAVLCYVNFNVTPITGHIGARAAPGTIVG